MEVPKKAFTDKEGKTRWTPPHRSNSYGGKEHATLETENGIYHIGGNDFPWPIGNSDDSFCDRAYIKKKYPFGPAGGSSTSSESGGTSGGGY